MVGGPASDLLVGGLGRSILIGGGGSDLLVARGAAILIGGTTDYDTNVVALDAVLAEWSRTDASYQKRISDLLGPTAGGTAGGLNSGYYLNPTTVHNDGVKNILTGGYGLDWFFPSAQDLVLGLKFGEVVTKIS